MLIMSKKMIEKLKEIGKSLKQKLLLYKKILEHPQTPWYAKALLWLAIGYVMLPFDLIPDFIPVIGHLDDLIIVPGLIYLAIKFIPNEIVVECKNKLRMDEKDENV